MESSQSKHAHHVVKSFKKIIPDDASSILSAEHYEELALLIEAAIDSALVDQLEAASNIAKKAAKEIKALGR
ncbi:hypothetical protein Ga0123462_1537 [Mariprofundus ferrinatatus]|uniref:Uncharacterized protein n=1 Tax=Mariprofundus ferrinatatus TaxID=1921087 RepID=A0A2K8L505_9PROT|nr:hypothetical protein [Mariprofundus ferrinatatus]ATX82400.1 hypothetical protein Ga0123462_1537 [Mariprofundus ferrinatatus]